MPDARLAEVDRALERILAGASPDEVESETLECKEDPAERGGSDVRAARPDGVYLIAEACTCLANHEGGAVLVGLADRAHGPQALRGTRLEGDRLRRRVRELTAPPVVVSVRTRVVRGQRLLVLLVPRNAGTEPHSVAVSTSGGRRRPRRIATGCHDMVTLSELFAWLSEREGFDPSALPSGHVLRDARPTALEAMRDYLSEDERPDRNALARLGDRALLRRLGLLRDDGVRLTRGGATLLCPAPEPGLRYLGRSFPGARSEVRVERPGRGLIEELREVEGVIAGRNREIPLPLRGLVETTVNAISSRVVREALVNAIAHRDHGVPEPVIIDHVRDQLVVWSPGGFFGGVSADRLLTARPRTRNRSLADAFRSLGLAEREGTGIGRMYRAQVRLGHAPPNIDERDGGVKVTLLGGDPVPTMIAAFRALPPALETDVRAAVALHLLRSAPSVTAAELARAAQDDLGDIEAFLSDAEDGEVLRRTAHPRRPGEPAWRLADPIRAILGPTLPYFGRPIEQSIQAVAQLAGFHGRVRNADVQDLLGLTTVRASQVLREAVRRGEIRLAPGSASRGRGVWYTTPDTDRPGDPS